MFRVVLQSQGVSVAVPHHRGCHRGVCHLCHHGGVQYPCDAPSDKKVSFFDILLKNLTVAQVLRKKYLVFCTYL